MITIADLMRFLEYRAPFAFQESYDNSGLIYGNAVDQIKGLLISLDVTEEVMDEAENLGCNVILAHHPLIFGSLKKLDSGNPSHRLLIRAIRNNIALISFHTNFDNIASGVSFLMGQKLGISDGKPLLASTSRLMKLVVFVPETHTDKVREDLFKAGAGSLGNYDNCSFSSPGTGTFRPLPGSNPFTGTTNQLSFEKEDKLELVFPQHRMNEILTAMRMSHPYEEVAYDLLLLENKNSEAGTGWIGNLTKPIPVNEFLALLKEKFNSPFIRFSPVKKNFIRTVALCGGSGSFLIPHALRQGADAYVTSDLKYHQFFEPDGAMLLADIGHFESEIHFIEALGLDIRKKSPNFAVRLSGIKTNPVQFWV